MSITSSQLFRQVLGARRILIPPKPVLASWDIDSTLIPWTKYPQHDEVALQRYSHFTHQPDFRKNTFILLNTGRGLSAVQKLAPLLKKFPIDGLGLSDGQQFFLRKAQNPAVLEDSAEATEHWLKNLKPENEDMAWKDHLQGWSIGEMMSTVQEELVKQGFQEEVQSDPNASRIFLKSFLSKGNSKPSVRQVSIHPDQTCFEIKSKDDSEKLEHITEFADEMGRTLMEKIQHQWPNALYYINMTPDSAFIHIGPEGNSKASLVNHLLKHRFRMPPVAVISAGDSVNDLESLSPNQIAEVPNYPIMVGQHPVLATALELSPPERLEKVDMGKLDEGLQRQFNKIKSAFPFFWKQKPPTQNATGFTKLA